MIMCDVCNEWYHGNCVAVSEAEGILFCFCLSANNLETWLCQIYAGRFVLSNEEAQKIHYDNAKLLKSNNELKQKLVEREKHNLLKVVNDLMGRHIETLNLQLDHLTSQVG